MVGRTVLVLGFGCLVGVSCTLGTEGSPKELAAAGGAGGQASASNSTGSPDSTGVLAGPSAGGSGGETAVASTSADASSSASGMPKPCSAPGGTCCGSEWCALGENVCCNAQTAASDGQECTPGAGGCNGALAMPCDDSSDCGGGEVCCGHWEQQQGRYTQVSCRVKCETPQDQKSGDYVLCHPDAPNCPFGLNCFPDRVLGPPNGHCF